MRAAIAAAMARSKREIPHYYLSTTIDMSAALAWLRAENEKRPMTERLLPVVLLIKAVATALRDVPELNGYWTDGAFQKSAGVHVGCAISLRGGGLVAPALHDADRKDLSTLMRELRDLAARARAGSLRSSELADSTITVTNLGDQGVDATFGIIYPPQVALVGFGRIAERPWVASGKIEARPRRDRDAVRRSSRERRPSRRPVSRRHRPAAADAGDVVTRDDIETVIVDALTAVAPEIDPASIQSGVSFRDQLDLDSMDFLNFVLALHERLGVEIPEVDYPQLYTLDSAVAYLASKVAQRVTSTTSADAFRETWVHARAIADAYRRNSSVGL